MKRDIVEVILERVFESTDTNGLSQKITLQFGKPYAVSEPTSSLLWRCPFQLIGIGSDRVHEGQGRDSLDAFLVSLRIAEAFLESYGKRFNTKITWFDEEDSGLSPIILTDSEGETSKATGVSEEDFKQVFDAFFRGRDTH
jgi:hypothetical protein